MALTAQILPIDTVMADTLGADSVAADTLAVDSVVSDTVWYFMLEPPTAIELPEHLPPSEDTTGISWILTFLLGLFVIVAIRFRNNSKYLGALFKDAVEVRERGNVFDETVREESFMIILNVLWCFSAGVLLFTLVEWSGTVPWVIEKLRSVGIPVSSAGAFSGWNHALGMAICAGIAILWQTLMVCLYGVTGNVFADSTHTRMWLTGYLATTGLSTLIFFPLALFAVCYPSEYDLILLVALAGLIVSKLVFIWKGFRIFFREFTSWLLFLYYLCSLEIVPLILLFVSCFTVCATIL